MEHEAPRGRDAFARFRKLILLLVKLVSVFSLKRRKKWLVRYRRTTGRKGLLIRYILLRSVAKACGDNVSVFENVYLNTPENLRIGDNVSIHPMCYLEAKGGIDIGSNVSIAHGASILSTTHNMDSVDVPIRDQGITEKSVVIGDNVWIGCKATVLCGIEIGRDAVIGANAVVTHPAAPFAICAGVPAREIRRRK